MQTNGLRSTEQQTAGSLLLLLLFFLNCVSLMPLTVDDYGTLAMAEVLLEECLQENMDLLRSATPLLDKTQPGLCRAKSHLNTILSRGRLTVSPPRLPLG